MCVDRFSISTLASGTAPPLGSVIVPWIVPPTTCAFALSDGLDASSKRRTVRTTAECNMDFCDLNIVPPHYIACARICSPPGNSIAQPDVTLVLCTKQADKVVRNLLRG